MQVHATQVHQAMQRDEDPQVVAAPRELAGELPEGREVMRVTVKLRTASFFTSTHGVKLIEPTTDVEPIVEAALAALARFELDRPVRLLGVRAEFTPDHRE